MGDKNIDQLFQFGFAEMMGTMIMILIGNGIVAATLMPKTKADSNNNWLVICMGWLAALFIALMAATGIEKAFNIELDAGVLNPVFAINNMLLWAAGRGGLPPAFGIVAIIFQFIGAMIGATLVWAFYKPHFDLQTDKGKILGSFSTGPAIRNVKYNFTNEIIATAVLVIAISSFGALGNFFQGIAMQGPLSVGLIVFAVGMGLGSTTGFAMNPARDLGPRIVHQLLPIKNKGNSDWSYSWIPVVGPITGAILGLLISPGLFY